MQRDFLVFDLIKKELERQRRGIRFVFSIQPFHQDLKLYIKLFNTIFKYN